MCHFILRWCKRSGERYDTLPYSLAVDHIIISIRMTWYSLSLYNIVTVCPIAINRAIQITNIVI